MNHPSPGSTPTIEELFRRGNFTAVALQGSDDSWQTHAARGLIGQAREAIAGLARFKEPEARFHAAVASWIDGDESRAIAQLKDLSLPHAKNLLALIRKKRIHVLAQLDRGSQWDFLSALPKDGRFVVRNVGFKSGDTENRPYASVHEFYDRQQPPDFYVTKLVEWHLLPPDLQELPCPTLGHTADYDIHIQTVHPWLQLLDEVVVTDHTEWADVQRLVQSPVSTFPKAFGLGQLPPAPREDRPTDVFISGTAMHPYHPDKARLLHQLLDMPETNVKFINGFVSPAEYLALLGQTKVGFTYVRHPGAMPTRGLESLAMGAAIAVQEGSVLQLFLGEQEGVVTYDLEKGNLPQAVRRILADWPAFAQRAQRGAEIVRREFEMSRVAQQYFRFLTYLAARPREIRSRPKPIAPLEQKRSILLKGWIQAPRVNRRLREASLLRWSEALAKQPTPGAIIDATRETLLEYATAAYQPVARDFSRNFRTQLPIRRELLVQSLDLLRAGARRFPASLVIRFNWIRAALHFGEPHEVTEALQMLDETLAQPASHWQVDPVEDVFPWDYFSQFFNYRAYFDTCTAQAQDGASRQEQLVRLILASLNYYRSFYAEGPEQAGAAANLDPEFPFYRLQAARRLIATRNLAHHPQACAHLEKLIRGSMLFLQAHEELQRLRQQGFSLPPGFALLSAKVDLARRRMFSANYGVEDWDAIPLRPASPATAPLPVTTTTATLPPQAGTRPPRILFLPLEIVDWRQARHVAYPVQLGLEEALRQAGADVVTLPLVRGLAQGPRQAWLDRVRELTAGQRFDQVWFELVHSEWSDASLDWITTLAPTRVGFLMESLGYDEQACRMMPKLRKRRALVENALRAATHAIVVDEADVEAVRCEGRVASLWWPQSVPERCLRAIPGQFPDGRAIFYGQVYGQRQNWLEAADLKQLMIRPDQSPEDAAGWPAAFDALNRAFATALDRSSHLPLDVFAHHVEGLRRIRREAFDRWIDGLQHGSAIVNLPSLFSGYAGRVFEAVAAGRPVVSWEVPNRPRTRQLFTPDEEILLYPADNPARLAELLRELRRNPERAHAIAVRAQARLRQEHTTERRVAQILGWIAGNPAPAATAPTSAAESSAGAPNASLLSTHGWGQAAAFTDPGATNLLITVAGLQARLGETEASRATTRAALNLQPANPAACLRDARLASSLGQWNEFANAAHQALNVEPDHAETWQLIAQECFRHALANEGLAVEEFLQLRTSASELSSLSLAFRRIHPPKDGSSPAAEAPAALRDLLARLPAARTTAERRVRRQTTVELPAAARVGDIRPAHQLFKDGRLAEAWTSAVAAVRARPFHPEGHLLLAEIAQAAGRPGLARSLGELARAQAPSWKPARQFLKAAKPNRPGTTDEPGRIELAPYDPTAGQRLSVCLITRNEEQFLDRCLSSLRGLAAETIVVDTGSHDRTIEIAQRHGAQIHHFTWVDDFSAARNAALEHATGDWILFLDADEELLPEDRDKLARHLTDATTIAFRLPMIEVDREEEGVSYVPRLFRNAPGLFYVGRVHEQVFTSIEVRRAEWGLENKLGEATLLHHGYTRELVLDRDKVGRNLRLLELAVEEIPGEPSLLMNLGLELVRDQRFPEGLERYRQAFEAMSALPPHRTSPELREALLTQYATQLFRDTDYAAVAQVLQSPIARAHGLTATMHWLLGLACIESKLHADGADQMLQCIAKRGQRTYTPASSAILRGAPHHCLALALGALKRYDEAGTAFQAALKADPDSRPIRFDYARLLAETGQPVEALKWAHQLMAEEPADVRIWQFGGHVALSKPEFLEFALDWTGEAVKHHPNTPALAELRATALLLAGQPEEALPLWQQLATTGSPGATAALIACSAALDVDLPPVPAPSRIRVDAEFLRWYRRLLEFKSAAPLEGIHRHIDQLRDAVPQTTRMLEAAFAEAATA